MASKAASPNPSSLTGKAKTVIYLKKKKNKINLNKKIKKIKRLKKIKKKRKTR